MLPALCLFQYRAQDGMADMLAGLNRQGQRLFQPWGGKLALRQRRQDLPVQPAQQALCRRLAAAAQGVLQGGQWPALQFLFMAAPGQPVAVRVQLLLDVFSQAWADHRPDVGGGEVTVLLVQQQADGFA